jgi:hypothetical protein
MAYCNVCGITVPYFADSCPKCSPKISSKKNQEIETGGSDISNTDVISPTTAPQKPGNFKLLLWIGLTLVIAAFIFNSNSKGGVGTGDESESGYWVSKCRTVTELNPDYYDSDPSSITDNLNGPSRFVTRRQCTDVWVEN